MNILFITITIIIVISITVYLLIDKYKKFLCLARGKILKNGTLVLKFNKEITNFGLFINNKVFRYHILQFKKIDDNINEISWKAIIVPLNNNAKKLKLLNKECIFTMSKSDFSVDVYKPEFLANFSVIGL